MVHVPLTFHIYMYMYMYSEGYSTCFVCVSDIYMYMYMCMYYSGGIYKVTGGYRGLH